MSWCVLDGDFHRLGPFLKELLEREDPVPLETYTESFLFRKSLGHRGSL